MPSPRRRAHVLRPVALAFGLGLLLTVLPLPSLSFATVSVGHSVLLPTVRDAGAAELDAAVAESGVPLAGARVAASDPVTGPFTSIGLTFEERPVAPVLLRTRGADGTWDPWHRLDVSSDDGPDGTRAASTDPVWVGSATGYEVNLGGGDTDGTEVVTVRDELRRSTIDATPVADAAITPPTTVRPRSDWGARAASSAPSIGATVKLAVVHHSASGNTYTQAEVPAVLRSVQAFHMDGRGWSDIAYNFVVDRFGGVWEGRGGGVDRPVVGAHARGFNTNTVGVMVLGDFTQPGIVPSAAVIESVSRVIGWKMALHRTDPTSRTLFTSGGSTSIPAGKVVDLTRVVGHKDVGATGCPGSIYAALDRIRARAQQWTTFFRTRSEPRGVLESVVAGVGTVRVGGFAFDPDAGGAARVKVTVGARTADGTTGVARPDVVAQPAYALFGPTSGFVLSLTGVLPGRSNVCVRIVDQGAGPGDVPLGCRTVDVVDPTAQSPTGSLATVTVRPAALRVTGTAVDPGATSSVRVEALVDGALRRAGRWRSTPASWPAAPMRCVSGCATRAPGSTPSSAAAAPPCRAPRRGVPSRSCHRAPGRSASAAGPSTTRAARRPSSSSPSTAARPG